MVVRALPTPAFKHLLPFAAAFLAAPGPRGAPSVFVALHMALPRAAHRPVEAR